MHQLLFDGNVSSKCVNTVQAAACSTDAAVHAMSLIMSIQLNRHRGGASLCISC